MNKNYYILSLLFLFLSLGVFAQEGKQKSENLGFYPNPVNTGKIYITSNNNSDKDVTIYDVLGKKVFQITVSSKEVNISTIPPGVYIIKIEDGDDYSTRKLIIR